MTEDNNNYIFNGGDEYNFGYCITDDIFINKSLIGTPYCISEFVFKSALRMENREELYIVIDDFINKYHDYEIYNLSYAYMNMFIVSMFNMDKEHFHAAIIWLSDNIKLIYDYDFNYFAGAVIRDIVDYLAKDEYNIIKLWIIEQFAKSIDVDRAINSIPNDEFGWYTESMRDIFEIIINNCPTFTGHVRCGFQSDYYRNNWCTCGDFARMMLHVAIWNIYVYSCTCDQTGWKLGNTEYKYNSKREYLYNYTCTEICGEDVYTRHNNNYDVGRDETVYCIIFRNIKEWQHIIDCNRRCLHRIMDGCTCEFVPYSAFYS